jgi:citrate lyase subunit beta/citryl-CoA lyase
MTWDGDKHHERQIYAAPQRADSIGAPISRRCARESFSMMRSKLFVPGSRPELFAKALAGPADAISIDLEDAVLESRKEDARQSVRAFLHGLEGAVADKLVIVRVNDMGTPHFVADLAAVVSPGLYAVNLPKLETAADAERAAAMLTRLESQHGLAEGQIGILANIESPRGLRNAAEIALASPRIVGLQIGFGDLFEPLGIDRTDTQALHGVQLAVRLAAGEAGIPAYDGAYANVSNQEGYRQEAQRARRLGFAGKSCIHPSQVPLANQVFQPTQDEVGFAMRVLAAWQDAERRGLGAITVEGRMIDKPFVVRARAMVAAGASAGTPPTASNIKE